MMKRMLHFAALASTCVGFGQFSFAAALNPLDASGTTSSGETAQRSSALVGFLGVNVNANVSDAQWQPQLSALSALGVQHVRDFARTTATQPYFDHHAAIGALGVRSIYTVPHGRSAAVIEQFAARVAADIEGLEAPSGSDVNTDTAWIMNVRADVTTIHGAATTLGLPTFGPSLGLPASYASLGSLSSLINAAGVPLLHCAGVDEPTSGTCATSSLPQTEAAITSQPFMVSGQMFGPAVPSQLTPAIAAVYLPRVLLEEWNAGAQRSYRPDVLVGSTNDFALLDKSGAQTPAFRALAALVNLLGDSDTTFQPSSLSYSLTGVDSTVHHALFQKHDGSFYLALWIDAPSYDLTTHKPIAVPGQVATLTTADPMAMTLYQFDDTGKVTSSSAAISTPQTVAVSDRLLVVKLATQTSASGTSGSGNSGSGDSGSGSSGSGSTSGSGGSSTTSSDDTSSTGTTYYVSSSTGNDANDGLSSSSPWKTIAKLNNSTSLYKPGTAIVLKRGDIFRDDYIRILNNVIAKPATTLANTPPAVAGTASQPIVIGAYGSGTNPILDGADPLNVTWTPVTATTWQATVPSMPSKIFVDSVTAETTQLIPQPNAVGAWHANTAYNFLDLVTQNGFSYVVWGPNGAARTPSLPYGQPYVSITNFAVGNSSQSFSSTKSGLANVESTPGSWYGTGNTVYVHLADGSNPNAHTLEGSYRPFGVILMSVNYVTVKDLIVERPQTQGIALGTWTDSSLAGHYTTNEYNSVLNTQVWNWGNLGDGCLTMVHSCFGSAEAGILSEAFGNGSTGGAALRGTVISGNYVGRSDQYFGLRSRALVSGIQAIGQNGAVISNNRIVTINNQCLNYQAVLNSPNNIGGDISYNYCGNNQGNFFYSATTGGRLHHNVAANSYGEGIQIGGNDAGGMIDHNLLYNLGQEASQVGYNGIDCNQNGSYMTLANNTIVNVSDAAITLETGCDHVYIVNNVLDLPKGNYATFYYYLRPSLATATLRNNLYSFTSNVHPWYSNFLLAGWAAFSGETGAQQADPVFVNPSIGDYRLASGSLGFSGALSVSGLTGTALGADLNAADFQ